MKTVDTITGNKLIAAFMEETGLTKVSNDKIMPYDKRYNNIWQNLMPVVEKIEAMDKMGVDCRVTIEKDTCRIYYNNQFDNSEYDFSVWQENNKKEAIWQSAVQFIQYYNSITSINKTNSNEQSSRTSSKGIRRKGM